MKSRIFASLVLLILGSGFVLGLFRISQTTDRNGFERAMPTTTLQPKFSIEAAIADPYFAGAAGGQIYLGSLASCSTVAAVQDSTISFVKIDHGSFPKPRVGKIAILSPYFFLADLVEFRVYRGKMKDWRLTEEIHKPGEFFTELVPLSIHSLALRTYRSDEGVFALSKENYVTNEWRTEPSLLEKQLDGIFCTDGMLQFDRTFSKVVYTYFSRNQFICTDSSLQLLYRGTTIDTSSHVSFKIGKLPGRSGYTMASPPHIVNRRTSVSDNTLYVNSTLVADNENEEIFKRVDVLDIYDLADGQYERSIYLQRHKGKKLTHFMVDQDRVFTLTETILQAYQLN